MIILGGTVGWIWMVEGIATWGHMPFGITDDWIHGWDDIMYWMGFTGVSFMIFSIIGICSGILILIGSIMLYLKPRENTAWGTIILIFSIISLVSMGGFFVGAILGITGGALALSWRPKSTEELRRDK